MSLINHGRYRPLTPAWWDIGERLRIRKIRKVFARCKHEAIDVDFGWFGGVYGTEVKCAICEIPMEPVDGAVVG